MREGKKRGVIILNGISLKKKIFYHEYLPAISGLFDVEVHETLSKHDARNLASKFTARYVDFILVAGGDGTLHHVVNGILKGRENDSKLPEVGIIPIGNANDFVLGAGLKATVDQTLKLLSAYTPRPVDVGVIEYSVLPEAGAEKRSVYFINVADIGMGPDVVDRVLASGRPFGSRAAYFNSILKSFLTYKPMVVKATSADWTWEGKLRSLVVANGKYLANGLCIAPDSVIDDRLFSVFACGNASLFDFLLNARALRSGKYINNDHLQYKTTTGLHCTSENPCPIEADGELLGWLPAEIKLFNRQLNFLI